MGPARWLCAVYALIWAYTLTVLDSPTGHLADDPSVMIPFFAVASLGLWASSFLLQLGARLALLMARVTGESHRASPPWRWTWLVFPAIGIAAWWGQGHGLVWKLRWWHAQDSFNAIRAQMAGGGPPPTTPRWVGTFRVRKIEPWSSAPRLSSWYQSSGTMIYWLGWPDTAYSDMTPAIISSPDTGIAGWPVTEPIGNGWFACMDNT